MKKTTHQFIDKYPIKATDKILILGTIHPHDTHNFKMPFFYGNRNSIWNILQDAFPDEIPKNYSLENILHFLKINNIAVSDTIVSCSRKSDSSLDKDLIPGVINKKLFNQIKRSDIIQILCTSGFGKNNAFKIFYDGILGLKINKEIRVKKQAILPEELFGRRITVTILPSPSGAGNIPLSKTSGYLQSEFFGMIERPVYLYKVSLYQDFFNKVRCKN